MCVCVRACVRVCVRACISEKDNANVDFIYCIHEARRGYTSKHQLRTYSIGTNQIFLCDQLTGWVTVTGR